MELTEFLGRMGLTANEAKIYLNLIKTDRTTAGELARKTGLHRRSVYDCLNKLIDRGLIGYFVEGRIRYYSALSPSRLIDNINEMEELAKEFIPKLKKLAKQGEEITRALVLKGKSGLKAVCEDVLREKPRILYSIHSLGKKAVESLPYYIPQFHKKRIHRKIRYRAVYFKEDKPIERVKELNDMPLTTARVLPFKGGIPISIWIYANKVAFIIWDNDFAILIEDQNISKSFKRNFSVLWKISK